MKKSLLCCLLFWRFVEAGAQVGFSVMTNAGFAPAWQAVVENALTHRHTKFLQYGTSGAADYAFRLRHTSLRLRPALHFHRFTFWFYPHYFEVSGLGLQANLDVPLFTELGKKEGKVLFRPYLQLSPGLDLAMKKYDRPVLEDHVFNGQYERFQHRNLALHGGLHLLVEFRLSSLMTVTPLAGVRFYPRVRWKNFTEKVADQALPSGRFDRTTWRHSVFGLRIGLDLKKRLNG